MSSWNYWFLHALWPGPVAPTPRWGKPGDFPNGAERLNGQPAFWTLSAFCKRVGSETVFKRLAPISFGPILVLAWKLMQYRYLLSLGSNLGHRHSHLLTGIQLLGCEVQIKGVTRIIETIPMSHPELDVSDHPPYLNCVLDCATDRTPTELYEEVIKPIEDVIGHDRDAKWLPRELDIDVLFWAHNEHPLFHRCSPLAQHGERGVTVPHVGVWSRPFLLDLIENDLKVDKARLLDVRA